jgi:uncharacterized pyridoxal phosphate-containing UPF0001 family protein
MVVHLQTNKVGPAWRFFDVIESVDSFHLAKEISKRASALERIIKILIEVTTFGEESKLGISVEEALDLVSQITELGEPFLVNDS